MSSIATSTTTAARWYTVLKRFVGTDYMVGILIRGGTHWIEGVVSDIDDTFLQVRGPTPSTRIRVKHIMLDEIVAIEVKDI